MALDGTYETVTAMIAPALFMTASGSLIISSVQRIGRIFDRIRVLVDLGDRLARGVAGLDFPEERQLHIETELHLLQWRNRMALVGVTMLHMACGSFVGTSLAIGIDSITGSTIPWLATAFAVAGASLLMIACLFLVNEARTALRSNDLEVRFYRELQARRKASSTGAKPV